MEPKHVSQHSKPSGHKTKRRRSRRAMPLLIAIILIALAVLVFLWFRYLNAPLAQPAAQATPLPEATAEPLPEQTSSPEPTAEPTAEPVPEPEGPFDYVPEYSSVDASGEALVARAFDGSGFYASSSSVADDGISFRDRIYYVDSKGAVTALAGYSPKGGIANPGGWKNFHSDSELSGITLDGNGGIYALECVYASGFSGPDGMQLGDPGYEEHDHYEKHWFLRSLDSTGKEISSCEIAPDSGIGFNAAGLKKDAFGKIWLLSDAGLAAVGEDGSLITTVPFDGYADALILSNEGLAGISVWSGGQKSVSFLDPDGSSLVNSVVLPASATAVFDGAGNYSFFYTSGVEFYGHNASTGSDELIFNWSEADVSAGRVSLIASGDGRSFCCLFGNFNPTSEEYESGVVSIAAVPEGQGETRRVLTLASVNPIDELQDSVAEFNRSQTDCRIILKAVPIAGPDFANLAALQAAFADADGAFPDIIDLTGLPYEYMASKGMLAELGQYIDADPELSRDSVLPSVLKGLEVNGGIYGTCSGFSITTVVGSSRLLGNMESWTYNDCNSILSTAGEGTQIMGAFDTQANVLYDALGISMHRYIDAANRSCDFSNYEFTQLLDFIRSLPADYRDEDPSAVANNVQILRRSTLYSCADLITAGLGFAGEPVYIGLPVSEGSGNVLNLQRDFAVSSACKDIDAAWKFVRNCFTEEYQADSWCFPSNASAFEAFVSAACEKQYDEAGEAIPLATDYSAAEPVPYYTLSAAQADALRRIAQTGAPSFPDEAVYELVLETCGRFLSGDGASSGTASLVQDAVTEYLQNLE